MVKLEITNTITEDIISRCTSSSNAMVDSARRDVSDNSTTSKENHQHLPAEVWAHSLNYLLVNASATNTNSHNICRDQHQHQHQHQPQVVQYADLLQLSIISRQFLHDVSCLIPTIHITSPSQLLKPKVASARFGSGVREVTIDCLFAVQVQQSSTRSTASTTKPAQSKVAIRPNADAYCHVTSFLSGFPNLKRVVLGGHQILDRSLSFAEDGYTCKENSFRNFHPIHTEPSSSIGAYGGGGAGPPIVSNLESFLRGDVTLDDDATTTTDDGSTATASTYSTTTSTATSANPFISAHQYDQRLQHNEWKSNLICSICEAYSSGTIPSNTTFSGLLNKSCCPTRARNGGIILTGPDAESCEFCTNICHSFPIQDIKNVLLDPTNYNYEESVFDRIFCMSSQRILQTLVERDDVSSSSMLVDVDFVAKCLVNKRFATLDAILDLNLLPSVDEDASTFISNEVEKALSMNQIKPDIPRDLFQRIVKGGISLRSEAFAIFE